MKINIKVIERIINDFANESIIFANEAQFQFDLAWKIREQCSDYVKILLEGKLEKNEYTDIVIDERDSITAIELKYKLADKEVEYMNEDGEKITTSAQGAADAGSYDYLKDVQRLEVLKKKGKINKGFAIMISNYPIMWGSNVKDDSNWSDFHLKDKQKIKKEGKNLFWKDAPTKAYSNTITLQKSYDIKWEEYKLKGIKEIVPPRCRTEHPFKYLIIEV